MRSSGHRRHRRADEPVFGLLPLRRFLRIAAPRIAAQAEREAARLRAEGEASYIVADGGAQVDVLHRMTEMYKAAGPDAQNIFLLNLLPELVEQISSTVAGIDVDKITIIDQGGAGAVLCGTASCGDPAAATTDN